MATAEQTEKLEHVYTIPCEDVRVEVGPKLSLMGVVPNIITVQQFPVMLFKFAVVSPAGAAWASISLRSESSRRIASNIYGLAADAL